MKLKINELKKRMIYFAGLLLVILTACTDTGNMTKEELKIINNGDIDTPFRVLLTTNEADSLFLRRQCTDVDVNTIATDTSLQLLIDRLDLTMEVEAGVGIAAPQVGIGRNVFLFMRMTDPDYPIQVAINPRIVAHSTTIVCFEGDGCLSIPNTSGNTNRYEWVDVEYYDETGQLIKEHLTGYSRETGFMSVVFQHEFDHLQGILFIDRLCD